MWLKVLVTLSFFITIQLVNVKSQTQTQTQPQPQSPSPLARSISGVFVTPVTAQITTKNFQINFLNELMNFVDVAAHKNLNQFLKEESKQSIKYELYSREFEQAEKSPKLQQKVVFIKQLLDMKKPENDNSQNFYTLRNVNFLKKLIEQLKEMLDEKVKEIRQLRIFQLCKQFQENTELREEHHKYRPPYPPETKLAPIDDFLNEVALQQRNQTLKINVLNFGRQLYENVKFSGAEIIDEYLSNIRELLAAIIEERNPEEGMTELSSVLGKIDEILNTTDFYEKRQRLYGYLQGNLQQDYEKFSFSEDAQEVLTEIFSKLKNKGMDLFVSFLFSNFEFLERLNEEWLNQLTHTVPLVGTQNLTALKDMYAEESQILFQIPVLYKEFKKDPEDSHKYESYLQQVKLLHERTADMASKENMHIFEMLYSSSMNVGRVTLNMIKGRCLEL